MRYLFLLLFIGCNPVKQVLRDPVKLEEVAKVVIKGGWCANDTTYIVKSDTTIKIDTLVEVYTDVEISTIKDTTYLTKWKTKTISKTLTIRDTLRSYIVDNSRIKLLEADSTRLSNLSIEYKAKASNRLNLLLSLLLIVGLYIFFKIKKYI
jgi:hypothetical protein